jgi:hypothetical protein
VTHILVKKPGKGKMPIGNQGGKMPATQPRPPPSSAPRHGAMVPRRRAIGALQTVKQAGTASPITGTIRNGQTKGFKGEKNSNVSVIIFFYHLLSFYIFLNRGLLIETH